MHKQREQEFATQRERERERASAREHLARELELLP